MARNRRDPLADTNVDNSPLTANLTQQGVWGLPSDEGLVGQSPHALVPAMPAPDGIFVDVDDDAVTTGQWPPQQLLGARVDAPASFQLPHEATHRRYEPILQKLVNQAAAGYTLIAAPNQGLHYVKIIAVCLTLDAAGTIKFVTGGDGASATGSADLTGAMNFGGAATAPLLLPPAELQNPWLYNTPDQPLGIVTATGKAQGWIMFCYSPYDS